MNILIDTCTFLWLVGYPEKLSAEARMILSSPSHSLYLSTISVWEIALKVSRKKLTLNEELGPYIAKYRAASRIESLPLQEAAVALLATLPHLHRDPFDRMLVCQAK